MPQRRRKSPAINGLRGWGARQSLDAFLRQGVRMSERHAFGPNLRRVRLQRGITIDQIAAATKISADLWSGLEQNDLSRWPAGLYARAYVRAYALEIGVDPEATVDEFCRCFPAGDRRAGRLVREQAALLGHDLQWRDDLGHIEEDRRSIASEVDQPPAVFTKGGRVLAAGGDAFVVLAVSTAVAMLLPVGWIVSAAACAFLYHALSLVTLGCTPAVWTIDTYLSHRHPSERQDRRRFLRLLRGSHHAKA
jgi:transcriptional regulator with XRE-family HTH domain